MVCLQETKLADEAFTDLLGEQLASRGYEVALHGEVQWNGVAILSKVGLDDVVPGVDGAPGFPLPEARAVSATCGGIRVTSVYVPNGRVPDSDHYRYKLELAGRTGRAGSQRSFETVVCGDMNIAPTDEDVFDPEAYIGQTHVTRAGARGSGAAAGSRAARRRQRSLARKEGVHLLGLPRRHVPPGLRHAHRSGASPRLPVADRVRGGVGRPAGAQGSGPSDHAPVMVDLDEAPDGDIGPRRSAAVSAGQAESHPAAEPRRLRGN